MPRALLTLVLAAALVASTSAAGSSADADVRAAIEQAVRARLSLSATVLIDDIVVRRAPLAGDAPTELRATPDAGSRIGGPMRFLLSETTPGPGARRIGSADATVRVSAAHVRVVRPIARGAVITAADVVEAVEDLGRIALEPLPTRADVVGAAARRPLAAGALVLRHSIAATPLVRSGDEVTTIVRVGSLEARGRAIAAQTAARGELVRLVSNRRNLRGRVVGAGEVEIER